MAKCYCQHVPNALKEIERLIQKLEIDKEILADTTDISLETDQ
jgi:hypothetical protein